MTTGRTPLIDSLKALVAAGTNKGHFYDLRSGSLADMWGTLNLSPNGGARLQRNGGACDVLGTDRFASADTAMSGPELSFGCYFFRGTSLPSGANIYCFGDNAATLSAALAIVKSNNRAFVRVITDAGTKTTVGVVGAEVAPGAIGYLSASARNNSADGLRCYKNGTAIAHADVDFTGATIAYGNGGLSMPGALATVSMSGIIFVGWEINKYLTPAEHAQLYDEIVNQMTWETNNLIINSTYPTIGTSVWEARYGLLAGEQTMSAGQSLGQLDPLKVVSGTHKASTELYSGVLAKTIVCVTAGDIILPDPRPDLGTTWAYRYYDDSAAAWESRTSATATVALDDVGDRILWATADGRTCLRKY